MFDQLKSMRSLAGLLGNAGDLKAKFEQVQEDLEARTAEGEAGGGAVRVTVNGKMQVVAVQLDPALVAEACRTDDGSDHAMIEQLVLEATNAALTAAQDMVREQMAQITGGLNLPGF